MSRRSKGPRLYLRAARPDRAQDSLWVIRDGSREISTGCPEHRLSGPDGAEQKLADYIAQKWAPGAVAVRSGDPASVLVAEVLAFYAQKKAPKLANPGATAARVKALADWWGDGKTLADVKLSTCEAYVEYRIKQPLKQARRGAALEKRVTVQGARRELEDLSAAITFWAKEYPLHPRPVVTLPAKDESPRDALTRDQAAALLLAAMGWRRERVPPGSGGAGRAGEPGEWRWKRLSKSARANRAHLRRFVLIGLYTGTRPGVIPKLLWEEAATQAWVDLEAGTIYRRGKREREHRTKKRPLVKVPRRLLAHLWRWKRLDDAHNSKLAKNGLSKASSTSVETEKRGITTRPVSTVLHHGGEPITGKIRRGFAACVRDAGLDPDITPHWLRHTCATWLMEAGVDPWDAAGYTGMTTATLEKCYGHHRPDHQDKARRALSGGRT